MTRSRRGPALAGAVALGGLSALHLAWAAGSAFPARDRDRLAELMAGTEEVPSAAACVVVGAGLAVASALVGAAGARPVARWGRRAVAGAFLTRGVAGLTGRTRLLVPWTPDGEFVRLDRRYYGPLCLAIAAAALADEGIRPDDR